MIHAMDNAAELSSLQRNWKNPDIARHAVASASMDARHPGLCFELGDANGDQFIPHEVVDYVVHSRVFTVAIWQPKNIYVIEVRHTPERTHAMGLIGGQRPVHDYCTVRRYAQVRWGAFFVGMQENIDPRDVCPSVGMVLRTPLGQPPEPNGLLESTEPISRIVIEFSGHHEPAELPLDTSIGSLALLATQEYFDMTEPRHRV